MTTDLAEHDIQTMGQLKINGPKAFEKMRIVGKLAAGALDMLTSKIIPGMTTDQIDRLVFEYALEHECLPAPLHYRGFRKSCCTSINHVVCHGIPSDRVLRDGDVVNVDVTLIRDGWHGDTNRMYFVGKVNRKAERLCEITYEAMMRGIAAARPGATLGDVGAAIQTFAEAERCSIVREFCGHGIGRVFHDVPNVLHYGHAGEGMALHEGMFFTVEPMVNGGKPAVKVLNDGWTAVTRDRSLSAQFEHTIGITADGPEIFTKSPAGFDHPPYA